MPLPTYPFERQRYWIDASPQGGAAALIRPAAGEPSEFPEAAGAPEPVVASLSGLAEHPRPALRNAYVAPRDAMETMVAAIWRQLLGIDEVGIHDDFFELGGHSFLTTRLVAEMREQAGVDLAIRDLFEKPTVAGFAAVVASEKMRQKDLVVPSAPLPQIVPDPASRHLPFSLTEVQQAYLMGRTDSFALGKVSTHFYTEIDVFGLDLERLAHAFRFLITRHDMLRAVVHDDGRQEILATVPPYEIAELDLRGRSEDEIEAAVEAIRGQMSHQVRPSHVWPLFELRASLFDGDRVRLHFSFDFLIGDAWSLQVLQPELGLAYHHRESEVPPLAISFRDYVLSLAALEEWPAYRRALAYWMERLPDFPPAPDLTLAKSPSAVGSPKFVRYDDRLEKEETRRLKELAARNGLTPSALLLAAFAEVLTVWSASPRFTINLTLFNRLPLHPEVDRLVGDFTSLTLLAIDNSRPAPFAERARLAQRQLFEDLDHSAVSGVRVLREMARRQGRHAPAMMPVVFTSTLNQTPPGEILESLGVEAKWGYGISQTPQVWIDHQVNEDPRGLFYSWDVVEELFPAGMIADMFAAYQALLGRLLTEDGGLAGLPPRSAPGAPARPVRGGQRHGGHGAGRPAARPVRRPGGKPPGVGGGDRGRSDPHLRRARPPGQRPRPAAPRARRPAEHAGGGGDGEGLGAGRRRARRPRLRRSLPADRPGAAARASLLPARNGGVEIALTPDGLGETLEWPAEVRWLAVAREDAERGRARAAACGAVGPRRPRLRDLHLGLDGPAEGRDDRSPRRRSTPSWTSTRASASARTTVCSPCRRSRFDLSVYDIFGLLAAGGAVVVPEAAERARSRSTGRGSSTSTG